MSRYEQGQEIHVGTARYVEMKSIGLMNTLKYHSSLDGLTSSLQQDFHSVMFPDILISDLKERMSENSVRPEDMLCNRIYPVGSAIGFLLDYFQIDWKGLTQKAGTEFTFALLFTDRLDIQKSQFNELVDHEKNRYGYGKILASTDQIIEEYLEGFNKELVRFESQDGYRICIDFTSKSLSRSRASLSKKWLVDKGTRSLCNKYEVYILKAKNMILQLKNIGVLEKTDWDAKKYNITFFLREISSVSIDDKPFTFTQSSKQSFQKIELSGSDCKFSYSGPGVIDIDKNKIIINLNP